MASREPMTPEEDLESAARALYYRDYEEADETPHEEWEDLSELAKDVWREWIR